MTAFSNVEVKRSRWQPLIVLALTLWLGGSLVLDLVVLPSLWATGMMTQPGFASAGYLTFGIFNHLELLFAALAMTGILALSRTRSFSENWKRTAIFLSTLLLGIPLIYTYILTPEMSALGIQLNLFDPVSEVPVAMDRMHAGYWGLELLKLGAAAMLLKLCYQDQ